MENAILYGKVKVFFEDKGFGFISTKNHTDYFFHVSSTKTKISEGDLVSFFVAPSKKKIGMVNAINVEPAVISTINFNEIIPLLSSVQKEELLIPELNKIDSIETDENYKKTKIILSFFYINNSSYHSDLIKNLFERCSVKFQIKFFLDKIYPKGWEIPYEHILSNIDEYLQSDKIELFKSFKKTELINFVDFFINKIGYIETDENYGRTKLLINILKQSGWSYVFIQGNIIKKLFDICDEKYSMDLFKEIIPLINSDQKRELLVSEINKRGLIEIDENYEKIKKILQLFDEKSTPFYSNVLKNLFSQCSEKYQIKFYFDNISIDKWEIPIDYILENIDEYLQLDKIKIFRRLDFMKLINFIELVFNRIGNINTDNDYRKIKLLMDLLKPIVQTNMDYHYRNNITKKLFDICTEKYKINYWIDGIFPSDFIFYIADNFENYDSEIKNKICAFINETDSFSFFSQKFKQINTVYNNNDFTQCLEILKYLKPSYQISELLREKSDLQYQYQFWLKGFLYLNSVYEINDFLQFIENDIANNKPFNAYKLRTNFKSLIKKHYAKNEYNYSKYGQGRLILKKLGNDDTMEKMMSCSQFIVKPFWLACLDCLSKEIIELIEERNFKYHILCSFIMEHIKFILPLDNSFNYTLCYDLINTFKESVTKGLKSFISKQTIKLRKEIIDQKVYRPFIQKIIESSSPEFRFQLTLDGHYENFDEAWIFRNIDTFDEEIIQKILSFRDKVLNQKILYHKVKTLPFINSLQVYEKAIELIKMIFNFDMEEYENYILFIKQNANIEYQIKLWLERYIKSLDIDTIIEYFKIALHNEKEEIIRNCLIKEQEQLFSVQLQNIATVNNFEKYEKLKTLLLLIRNNASYVYENVDWLNRLSIEQEYLFTLWLDGFKTTLQLKEIIEATGKEQLNNYSFPDIQSENNLFKNIYIRLSNLGNISTEQSFGEVKVMMIFAKDNLITDEYNFISNKIYDSKSDYCKIKLYLNDLIKLPDDRVNHDFNKIFKGQYFKLLKQEKVLFLNKAKRQLPDFNKEILKNIGISSLINKNEDGSKLYHTFYNDIYFNNGYFTIKLDDDIELFSKPREWFFSKYAFNILQSYFSNKQQKKYLRITINNIDEIASTNDLVQDLEELEKNILVVILQKKSISEDVKEVSETIKEAEYETISNKDLKRITGEENSECVHYLFENISDTIKPIYVNEAVFGENISIQNNIGSWLFSIPLSQSEFAIIWESVKLDRATHLFKIDRSEYEAKFNKIQNYLFNPSSHKREKLNSTQEEDRQLQDSLNYWRRINHDWVNQCESWYSKIKTLIPNLTNKK